MQLAQPSYLLLLWIIPAIVVFYLWAFRKKYELLKLFASPEMMKWILPVVQSQHKKALLRILAILFIIISLVRPQWGFHWETITRQGVDILVAIDVSQSMMAEDVKPSRLARAKQELIDLLSKFEGDRVGLIAFSGTAFLQCPLTLDYGAFQMFLDYLNPDLIPVAGTSLSSAIKVAMDSFLEESSNSRALIIITDGEEHENDPLELAKKAKDAGIKIYTIGVGADEGAPIPSPDGNGFIKDEKGEIVMTKLDEPTLQKIALETNGAYVRSTTGEMDLEKIYFQGIKKTLGDAKLSSSRQKRWSEQYQWPLFIAFLLLSWEFFASHKSLRKFLVKANAGVFFVFYILNVSEARADIFTKSQLELGVSEYEKGNYEVALQKFTDAQIENPLDPVIDYNLGNAYYKSNRYQEAEASYQKVISKTKNTKMKERAYYNLGNALYREGKLDLAINSYQEALKIDPKDEDAKANLAKAQEEIKRRKEKNKEQKEKKQEEKQNPENKKDQNQENKEQKQNEQEQKEEEKSSKNDGSENKGSSDSKKSDKKEEKPSNSGDEKNKKNEKEENSNDDSKEISKNDKQKDSSKKEDSSSEEQSNKKDKLSAGSDKPNSDKDGLNKPKKVLGGLSKEDAKRLLGQVEDAQKRGLRMKEGNKKDDKNDMIQQFSSEQSRGGKPW